MAHRFFKINNIRSKIITGAGLIVASSGIINPLVETSNHIDSTREIFKELKNRNVVDSKYYNYSGEQINEIYMNNKHNIDIDHLVDFSFDGIIKPIKYAIGILCIIPTYIIFKPISLYNDYKYSQKIIKEYYKNGQLFYTCSYIDDKAIGEIQSLS